jgi:hypothetical protein
MRFAEQRAQFEREGYAVFERVLEGPLLDLLRNECARVIEREDARLDALGVEVDGISHKGKRYFAGECQRAARTARHAVQRNHGRHLPRDAGRRCLLLLRPVCREGRFQGHAVQLAPGSGYVVGNGGPADHKPYLTCWCTLDDTTVANGTVRILPFSQAPETRDGIVPHIRQEGSNDLSATPAMPKA